MALFSTLLSASSERPASTSASIPTLMQLFTSKPIIFDENANLDAHAVLSYQALEVNPPTPEGESKLFQQRRSNNPANGPLSPNLGVWNCCISKNELVDSLLKIPDAASSSTGDHRFCMTVSLTDPSLVEPSMAMMHEALVRLLIQQPPPTRKDVASETETTASTSLAQLKTTQFGLAPDDKPTVSQVAEDDHHVQISLLICAVFDHSGAVANNKDEYMETQAQNLIIYHLRRYAAALNCSLCFVGNKTDIDVPTIPLADVAYTWLEWISSTDLTGKVDNVFAPNHHQPDLIETVLLRNAQHLAGHWDASKDSLWKALPPSQEEDNSSEFSSIKNKKAASHGDDGWLAQLRESVANVEAQPVSTPSAAVSVAPKTEDAAVSSFFENLLKK
ncbi:hypothetical protein MHU86_23949 [Fragilaria crotonensis]|nr:hypothetical protein MHU86_23949 [Fragilaria crotonensis]